MTGNKWVTITLLSLASAACTSAHKSGDSPAALDDSAAPTDSAADTSEPQPTGPWVDVTLGPTFGCALNAAGEMACWWEYDFVPTHAVEQISAGQDFLCATDPATADAQNGGETRTVSCWGNNVGTTIPDEMELVLDFDASWYLLCALDGAGTAECWGSDFQGESSPPAGTFTDVEAGGVFACGYEADAGLQCWGSALNGHLEPPVGTIRSFDLAYAYGCAIMDPDGIVECWGQPQDSMTLSPATADMVQVATGERIACALGSDERLDCWGDEYVPGRPAGVAKVAVSDFVCALNTDGSLECWGEDNTYGQLDPPV